MNSKQVFADRFSINKDLIEREGQAYFIADIGANHDGNLEKAKELIYLAAESGAHAAKFQHFSAASIVSKHGFERLSDKQSHQAKWKKSVYEVYQSASINLDWTNTLVDTCKDAGIAFFTSPYSLELVDYVDPYVPAFKIGSGDITWLEIIDKIAEKNKPVLLACGASSLDDVDRAVQQVLKHTGEMVIMQCNTNYTASLENFKYINLNVIKTLRAMYPGAILGLSDHTPGHASVLGAIALGANVIEKHFTDSNEHEGPDHKFAMNPAAWREMVDRSQELSMAMGDGVKRVEDNELETVVVQRRSIRLKKNIGINEQFTESHFECLRPCPADAIEPYHLPKILGRTALEDIPAGEHLKWNQVK